MGVVYTALDPQLNRTIALKLVRFGGGPDAQARLAREAQAMARLAHPNVVPVFDVGVFRHRVFVAMELVPGETVRHWLKREPRSWREIVALFIGAGRGLEAAHAAGMVHRDFKLDNVLVGKDGRARVTDFGLARAVADSEPQPGESSSRPSSDSLASPLTETGAMVGTPAYMAPELRMPSAQADARADEYSFCVSLYEALYGERPFDKHGELRAHATSKVPLWLRRIILRGLAKQPNERWPSMTALLAALSHDPTLRRRRVLTAAAAGVPTLGLVVALVVFRGSDTSSDCDAEQAFGSTWDATRKASVQTAFARANKPAIFTVTAANLDRASADWKTARVGACRVADAEAKHLRIACLEQQRVEIKALVDLLITADDKVIQLAGRATSALPDTSECSDVRSLAAVVKPPNDPKLRTEIEKLRLEVIALNSLRLLGRSQDAIAGLEPIAARAKQIGYRPLEAETLAALERAYGQRGATDMQVKVQEATLLAAEAAHLDRLAVRVSARLAATTAISGKPDESKRWLDRAGAILERLGNAPALEADLHFARGTIRSNAGRYEEALEDLLKAHELRRELLGPDHNDTLITRINLAATYDELARPQEAIEHGLAAIDGLQRISGPGDPRQVSALANLAIVYLRIGELAQADRTMERALPIAKELGPKSRHTAHMQMFRARVLLAAKRADDALAAAIAAREAFAASNGETNEFYASAMTQQAAAMFALGKLRDAEKLAARAVAIKDEVKSDMWLHDDLTLLGRIRVASKHADKAVQPLERALDIAVRRRLYPGELAQIKFTLARALGRQTPRAKQLASEARDQLAPLPYHADTVAAVDAFLEGR